jgi:hypothetical protein
MCMRGGLFRIRKLLFYEVHKSLIPLVGIDVGAGEGNRTLARHFPNHCCKWLKESWFNSLHTIALKRNCESRPQETKGVCHTLSHSRRIPLFAFMFYRRGGTDDDFYRVQLRNRRSG